MSGQEITGLDPFGGGSIERIEPAECKEITIAVLKRTMESVLDLLAEIVHPVVPFSKDQHEMALWVIEQNRMKAKGVYRLLGGEDVEIEEESNG